MTNRARWLVLLGLVGMVAGAARQQSALTLISLSTFVWVLYEWLRFQVRKHREVPQIQFERWLNGRPNFAGALWAGRKIHVEVRLRSRLKLSQEIRIRDVVPEIVELLQVEDQRTSRKGAASAPSARTSGGSRLARIWRWFSNDPDELPIHTTRPNEWTVAAGSREDSYCYEATGRSAGELTFPGLRLTLSDPYRFFIQHRFVELRQTCRLLPDYFQSGEMRPAVKRHNSLPRNGIHRLQRAGVGSELLELREYTAGDPPKSIAWKVSARRGRLMTRTYESEVPVRVRLFVDGSPSTRVGGFGLRLLDQMNFVAASVAKAATSVGDPLSGVLVDDSRVTRLPWLNGDRGFLQLLKTLADFTRSQPPLAGTVTPEMMQSVVAILHERYPELFERCYHHIPFSVFAARRQRFRVAGVLAEVLSLSPLQYVECCSDDTKLAGFLQEFVSQIGIAWMPPFSPSIDPVAAGARSTKLMAEAIGMAIVQARDNEVFVVLSDFFNCTANLAPLVRVFKLAVAKHHRVVVVCPTSTCLRPSSEPILPQSDRIQDLLFASEQARIRELATSMKRELVRLGVVVSISGERDAFQMVMAEIDMARDARTRPQGARG